MASSSDGGDYEMDAAPLDSPLHYLGHRLRTLRQARELSQRELAGLARVDPDQIRSVEQASLTDASAVTIEACDRALGAHGELIDLHRMIMEVPDASGRSRDAGDDPDERGSVRDRALVPRQLPPVVRDFTGRATDLITLDALLPSDAGVGGTGRPGAVVISAVDGMAGVGKTTLAVYWGHRMRHRFPDGSLYTNLRGYGPGEPATPGEVLDGFLRALGIAPGQIPASEDERSALYRSVLDGQRVLVVLDNASGPEQVRPLLPAGTGCLTLVTSRSSLTGLVAGQGAARISLDLLSFDEAVVLLRGIIGDARADGEPQAVAEIVRACARLPLALRIAGARAASRRHLRLADLQAELLDQRQRLDTLSQGFDDATAVRSVFAWSYQALPPEQSLMFRRLGLHPGVQIDIYAAAALAGCSPDQARRDLEALAEVHLVESTGPGRYLSHDLLRAYALERAEHDESSTQRAEALSQLLGFYLHTADAADRAVATRNRVPLDAAPLTPHVPAFDSALQAMEWFESEYANLTAAARCAAEAGLHALAWQLPAALNGLFALGGRRADWSTALTNALNAARALDDRRGELYILCSFSETLTALRRSGDALDHAHQALEIAQYDSDRHGEAIALHCLGMAHQAAERHRDAADCFEQSIQIRPECGDLWGEAISLNGLGAVHRELGRLDEALDCHQRALGVFRDAHDRGREGYTLQLIGDVHFAAGRLGVATDHHARALDMAVTIGDRQEEASALDRLGTDLHTSGDHHSAREHWQRALEIFERLDGPEADSIRARLQA